ncbi:MAG: hypothetical protein LBL74_07885 [Bacteroidales bacterium]|nr:hypothetical protein [Bacteroidales bacterium]
MRIGAGGSYTIFTKGCLEKMKQPFVRTKQPFVRAKRAFIKINEEEDATNLSIQNCFRREIPALWTLEELNCRY